MPSIAEAVFQSAAALNPPMQPPEVISDPRSTPLTWKSRPTTDPLSYADAESVTMPETVVPLVGAFTATVGGVVSCANATAGATALARPHAIENERTRARRRTFDMSLMALARSVCRSNHPTR